LDAEGKKLCVTVGGSGDEKNISCDNDNDHGRRKTPVPRRSMIEGSPSRRKGSGSRVLQMAIPLPLQDDEDYDATTNGAVIVTGRRAGEEAMGHESV